MSTEAWIILGIGGILIPCVGWLIREVLDLRGKMIALEARMGAVDANCARHQLWGEGMATALKKIDKNVGRLCLKAGVQEVD